MIVDDLDVESMPVTPLETDPPLLVDPNAVLALSITLQRLELLRARNRKVFQDSGRIQLLQLHQCPLLDVARNTLGVLAAPHLAGFLATRGFDHA